MNIVKLSIALLTPFALVAWTAPAHAVAISIFDSGLSSKATLLSDGQTDSHYTVNASPAVAVNSGFPISPAGPWTANTATSRWIAPTADQTTGDPGRFFTYTTTFDLTGLDPATAQLSGSLAADNAATISLNGASTGVGTPLSTFAFTPFSINSGFVAGVNTLTVNVDNLLQTTNPTGMQIQVSGSASPTAAPVPEPASLGLLGLSLAGLAIRLRRR